MRRSEEAAEPIDTGRIGCAVLLLVAAVVWVFAR